MIQPCSFQSTDSPVSSLPVSRSPVYHPLSTVEALMELFVQNVINGLTIGAFYALVALGLHHGLRRPQADQLRPRRSVHVGRLPGLDGADRGGAAGLPQRPLGCGAGDHLRHGHCRADGRADRAHRLSAAAQRGPPAADHLRSGRGVYPGEPGAQPLRGQLQDVSDLGGTARQHHIARRRDRRHDANRRVGRPRFC